MGKNKSEYKSLSEWRKAKVKDYQYAKHKGMLHDICDYYGWDKPRRGKGYWTLERCIEDAKRFKNKTEWANNSPSSLHSARQNGWVVECSKHMTSRQKNRGYWTKDKILKEGKKYKTRGEWKRKNASSYEIGRKKGWLKYCN